MKIQRKCMSCHQWSNVENTRTAICTFCGQPFENTSFERKRKRAAFIKHNQMKINKTDPGIIRFLKKSSVLFMGLIIIFTIIIILTHG